MEVVHGDHWLTPERALATALTVLSGPPEQSLQRLSAALSEWVPHRALFMLTGYCVGSPMMVYGDAELTGKVTTAELDRLAQGAEVGRPWFGSATLAGQERGVLAALSNPPVPAAPPRALLAVVTSDGNTPADPVLPVVQRLWDLVVWFTAESGVAPEPTPRLADNALAASERTRAIAEVTDGHAATLTTLLSVLRSRSLDDATARQTTTDVAASALIELRAAGDRNRTLSQETVGDAFEQLTHWLRPLAHHTDIDLELIPPQQSGQALPGDISRAARATVRGVVLAMLQLGVHRVRVSWHIEDVLLRITLRDDGPGTLTADAPALQQLTHTLSRLNGVLSTDPVPNWGTTVIATLPLTPPAPPGNQLAGLSARELEVLAHLADGRRNRYIGDGLQISERTVKFHVSNILQKLGVATRGEAAAIARYTGLRPGSTALGPFPLQPHLTSENGNGQS